MRNLRAVPGVLALSLVLAACSGGGDGPTDSDAPEPRDSGTRAATPATSPEPLPVDYAVEAVDFGEPGAVTPPGTALPFGTPAWLNQTVTVDGADVTGGVGVSVLEVRELDASVFDQFSNADEFAGYTPYAIITQHQWLYDVPEGSDPETLDLFPLTQDGADANYLTSGFSFNSPGDSCGLALPEYDEEDRVLVSCFVALSQSVPVTSAEYNGEGYHSIVASSENAYIPPPVTWQ